MAFILVTHLHISTGAMFPVQFLFPAQTVRSTYFQCRNICWLLFHVQSLINAVFGFFPSFRLSSFNQPPHGLFMDLMEPQSFTQRLIYDCIKDGCFPFDERGLI